MNLSPRERRLLAVLLIVIVVGGGWFLFLRPSGGSDVDLSGLFPASTPTVAPTQGTPIDSASPTFVIPVGARDPFAGGGGNG